MPSVIHHQIHLAYSTIRALAHPVRLNILQLVAEQQPVAAHLIYQPLNLTPAIASQQFRILKNAGLLHSKRRGKEVLYTVSLEKLQRIITSANTYCGG